MIKHNYHTHTVRCGHAAGTDEEYVRAAIDAGFSEIGFSDHSPWPFENGYVSDMRMHEGQLAGYVASVKELREKYRDKISIKIGLECEFFERYIPWLKSIIDKFELDYVILGHHFSPDEATGVYNGFITRPEQLENYKNEVIRAIESGLFSYVAHPDLFMRGYPEFDAHCEKISREIISAAMKADIPVEYNLQGVINGERDGKAGYPHPKFWHIAGQLHAKTIIGIDAHSPDAYLDSAAIEKAQDFLEKTGVVLTGEIGFLR